MPPTTNLQQGQSGPEVKQLQNFLIGQGLSIPSGPTGYFGNETKAALSQWQSSVGISPSTPGYGTNWGPKSIQAASQVNSNVAPQNRSVYVPPVVSTPSPQPSRTLTGIPGLAGGLSLSGGQVSIPQPPVYQPPQPQPTPTQPIIQPEVDTSTSAVYDSLIAADPLLVDFFKKPGIRDEYNNMRDDQKIGYIQASRSLAKALEDGLQINPELVKITPQQLQEFYQKAESEMSKDSSDYFQEQFRIIKGDLDRSVSRLVDDYQKGVSRSEEPFKQGLADQSQLESEQGTVYSSERTRREASTILGHNQKLQDASTSLGRSVQDLGIGYEKVAGSDLARSLNLPGASTFQASQSGYTPSSPRSLYIPLGDVFGSGQREKVTALKSRQNVLEQDYRKEQSRPRSLSII